MINEINFPLKSYIGWGALENLNTIIEKEKATNILLITDPFLSQNGISDKIMNMLQQKVDLFTDVIPEPTLQLAEDLINIVRSKEYDFIIGLGGGSALDLAKIASSIAPQEGKVRDYLNLAGTKKIYNDCISSVLIPTTSGTGSEVTNIAVLSLETTKDVITHDSLLSKYSIVDPALTTTLPPKVTASTGIDALTHAIEAYLSKNASTISDCLALEAINLITSSIKDAVKDGKNKEARINMSKGSYLAGLAFFNAGVGGVHALAYPLGGQFHIAHGESNALLLPYVMEYISNSCEGRMKKIYSTISKKTTTNIDCKEFINYLKELISEIGLSSKLTDYGIKDTDLKLLTEEAAHQTRLLARSPLTLEKEDIYKIYATALN